MRTNSCFIYLAFFTIEAVLSFKRYPQISGCRSQGYHSGKHDGRSILSDPSSPIRQPYRENFLQMSSVYGNVVQGDLTKVSECFFYATASQLSLLTLAALNFLNVKSIRLLDFFRFPLCYVVDDYRVSIIKLSENYG